MSTQAQNLPNHAQSSSLPIQASEQSWPKIPSALEDYYHDYYVRDQDSRPLFISAAFTGCAISPDYSHETILPNSCPHKSPLLYLELPLTAWDDSVFDKESGYASYFTWRSDLDIKSLTRLNFKSLTHHSVTSSPDRIFTASPSAIFGLCPSFDDTLTYPDDLDRALPIFRPIDPDLATYLFVKIPWRPKKSSPTRIEITRHTPLTGLHYWSAINDYYRIGVDYWLVPLAK